MEHYCSYVIAILFFFPFQECIKPVKVDRTPGKVGKIRIEDDGSYFNVSEV